MHGVIRVADFTHLINTDRSIVPTVCIFETPNTAIALSIIYTDRGIPTASTMTDRVTLFANAFGAH